MQGARSARSRKGWSMCCRTRRLKSCQWLTAGRGLRKQCVMRAAVPGSNARRTIRSVAKGLVDVLPDAEIEIVPMADGGEGTAEAVCDARGCAWLECKAHDPLGRERAGRCAAGRGD